MDMARSPAPKKQADISHQQMEDAIPKIEKRIRDLDAFDVNSIVNRYDPTIDALEMKLDTLISNIYGLESLEYSKYHFVLTNLDTASINMNYETPIHEVREGLARGIAKARATLDAIMEGFREELDDNGRGAGTRPLKAYEGLDLHQAIARAASQLYRDGHYANAIEDAVKALNALVRLNSGVDDKDGTSLMEAVFNPTKPVLKFNPLADQSDRDEQKGFMMMFSGAVSGLRNPRAHKLIKDDPESALEFIAFVSLLAKIADKSVKA